MPFKFAVPVAVTRKAIFPLVPANISFAPVATMLSVPVETPTEKKLPGAVLVGCDAVIKPVNVHVPLV